MESQSGLIMEDKQYLKIGEMVMWSGSWGTEPSRPAIVTHIELTSGLDKYDSRGEYQEVDWVLCNDRRVIVDLANGHWAYGYQLSQISDAEYEDMAHAAWAQKEIDSDD